MNMIFLLILILITYAAVTMMYLPQTKPNHNFLFGVSLPDHSLEDERLKQIKLDYKKSFIIYSIIVLLFVLPLFFIASYFSMALIYTFLWIFGVIYTSRIPFKNSHTRIVLLKREQDWFVGKKRLLKIDTEVSRLKAIQIISPYWFIIPVIISIIPIIIALKEANPLLKVTGIASLIMTIILFIIYLAFSKMKTKMLSPNNSLNAAINSVSKRYWSILWLCMAIYESCIAVVTYTILKNSSLISPILSMSIFIILSLVPLIGILFIHNKVKTIENHLTTAVDQTIYTDEDEYWQHGLTYNNPNDKTIMVPKRSGIGSTLNMATKTGRFIQYSSIVLAAIVILLASVFTVQADYTSPTLEIEDNGKITITYPMYTYSFDMEDVQILSLADTIPTGFRTNGTATAEYARGNFSLETYGETKLYIYKNSQPYILFKLKDNYVIYNDKEPAQTKKLFAELGALK